MTSRFRSLFRRTSRTLRHTDRCRPNLELLEDRLAPAGNILPTPGSSFDYARDIVQDPGGKVYVYNGTFTPYLASYDPVSAGWTQSTYAGWSTVSNISYGGLAQYQNFLYATDMNTAGAAA